jgi:alkanesulfonate monooxygenase SsuD/methylene tetrahydromethanopterin reductase-like flavin-dependent oxidoreductase (luciferase family)
MDRGLSPLDRFFEERLKLAEAYDAAGFYGYHVAEHHATPLGVAPSPGVWLAAIAQRTKRLRFGPLVYLLPLYHPIKLLEEICMLDHLSECREALQYKYAAYASWGFEGRKIDGNFEDFGRDKFIIGDKVKVKEEIARYHELLGSNHFIVRCQWPGLPVERTLDSIERLGEIFA